MCDVFKVFIVCVKLFAAIATGSVRGFDGQVTRGQRPIGEVLENAN